MAADRGASWAPPLSQIVINRIGTSGRTLTQISLLAALPVASFLVAVARPGASEAALGDGFRRCERRQTFLVSGTGAHLLWPRPISLLLHHSPDKLVTLARLTPALSVVAAGVLAIGLLVHRRALAPALSAYRTAGTAIALCGGPGDAGHGGHCLAGAATSAGGGDRQLCAAHAAGRRRQSVAAARSRPSPAARWLAWSVFTWRRADSRTVRLPWTSSRRPSWGAAASCLRCWLRWPAVLATLFVTEAAARRWAGLFRRCRRPVRAVDSGCAGLRTRSHSEPGATFRSMPTWPRRSCCSMPRFAWRASYFVRVPTPFQVCAGTGRFSAALDWPGARTGAQRTASRTSWPGIHPNLLPAHPDDAGHARSMRSSMC